MKNRFNEQQIIGFLKQGESGISVDMLCREHGFSRSTYYKWKAKYGGLNVNDAQRLKALESENTKLKRLLANSLLDIAALKDVLSKK